MLRFWVSAKSEAQVRKEAILEASKRYGLRCDFPKTTVSRSFFISDASMPIPVQIQRPSSTNSPDRAKAITANENPNDNR